MTHGRFLRGGRHARWLFENAAQKKSGRMRPSSPVGRDWQRERRAMCKTKRMEFLVETSLQAALAWRFDPRGCCALTGRAFFAKTSFDSRSHKSPDPTLQSMVVRTRNVVPLNDGQQNLEQFGRPTLRFLTTRSPGIAYRVGITHSTGCNVKRLNLSKENVANRFVAYPLADDRLRVDAILRRKSRQNSDISLGGEYT